MMIMSIFIIKSDLTHLKIIVPTIVCIVMKIRTMKMTNEKDDENDQSEG